MTQLDLFDWAQEQILEEAKQYGFRGYDEFFTIDADSDLTNTAEDV